MFTEPSWLTTARRLIGTQEIAGKSSNPVILGWAAALSPWVKEFYADDDIPWCGLYVGYCLQVNKIEPPKDVLAAKAYATWGDACDPAIPGTVLVFSRNGGGHVGFYTAEDEHHYHVLGGNQANAVNVTRIAKSRCIGRRWPAGQSKPWFGKPVWRSASGPVSTNEA
jgi:uncharacterized protein (TIGR02594 family)